MGYVTGQEEGLVHCLLLGETNVAEVLLALADGDDVAALLEHLDDQLLCSVLWQPTHKHRLTARRSLSRGWRWQI